MPNARESVCCLEISEVEDKMSELQTLDPSSKATCITEHPGFSGVCLDMWVQQTTAHHSPYPWSRYNCSSRTYSQVCYQYIDHYQHSVNYILLCHTTLYRQYRYIAYRQLTTWCWGYLGKHRRVVLPSCAVHKIREAFPSDGYIGFKYPHLPR